MKVEDYEYVDFEDLDDENTLTDERKVELIKKVKDQIVRSNIALHKILKIGKNDEEYNFIYEWLVRNRIGISGINGTLSGELEDYRYIKRLGKSELPKPLDDVEQQRLFLELDNMKKKGISKDSKEYQDIRQKLIVHNIRLAIWTVGYKYSRSLKNYEFEIEDLEQMAMEPLINAVDKYEIESGKKFSTYAVPKIYYYIGKQWRKSINNNGQLKKEWQRLEGFEEEMLKNFNRQPTDEEIKEFLGIDNRRLKNLKEYINFHLQESLEDLNSDDKNSNDLIDERVEEIGRKPILNGVYVDEDGVAVEVDTRKTDIAAENLIMKENLRKILDTLTDREKRILELRFGLDDGIQKTLEEVRL